VKTVDQYGKEHMRRMAVWNRLMRAQGELSEAQRAWTALAAETGSDRSPYESYKPMRRPEHCECPRCR